MSDTIRFKVHLPKGLVWALGEIAAAKGVPVTTVVKNALREYVAGFGDLSRTEEKQGDNQPEPEGGSE